MVRNGDFGNFTIKAVLFLGFGLTFGLWLFASYHFAQRMIEVERQAAVINERYMHAQDLLSTVRTQVLLVSVFVRDALIDPDQGSADEYRHRIQNTYQGVDAALQNYVPVLDSPAERERVRRLRGEIDEFRSTVLAVLATDSNRWHTDALQLLRQRVMPKRELVLAVADGVQGLNRAAFVGQQTETADVYRVTQRQMRQQLGLALATSIGIALLSVWYAGRLEGQLRRQRVKDVEITQDLQRLSARLIHAQEEERRRLARELHDQLGQRLTALKLNLETLNTRSGERTELGEHVAKLGMITRELDQDVDFLVWELRPTALDDLGLGAALTQYLQNWSEQFDMPAQLHATGVETDRLPPETEITLYRIAQEGLNNVAKHAQATQVDVILERRLDHVLLIIEDDGIGFEPSVVSTGGRKLGLVGMRERAVLIGATLQVESVPGMGTTIFVKAPMAPASEGA